MKTFITVNLVVFRHRNVNGFGISMGRFHFKIFDENEMGLSLVPYQYFDYDSVKEYNSEQNSTGKTSNHPMNIKSKLTRTIRIYNSIKLSDKWELTCVPHSQNC